jgi:predicted Zn-dependent peptidase
MIIVKNDAFKTVHLSFQFIDNIEEDAYAYRFLLARLLTSYTDTFPTKKKLIDEFSRLYGSFISNQVFLLGQYHIMRFTIGFPNPDLIDDDAFIPDLIRLLKEMFFERTLFNENNFKEVKRFAIEYLQTKLDRKFEYAKEELVSHLYPNHPYGKSLIGDINTIRHMTHFELFDYYQRYFTKNKLKMVICGDLTDDIIHAFESAFSMYESKEILEIPKIDFVDKPLTTLESAIPMQQAFLFLCYSLPLDRKDPLFLVAQMTALLIGGYPDSMLFKRFREELGLAYEVDAHFEYDKYYLTIFAGVDIEKRHDAMMELQSLMDEFLKHGPTQDELDAAKQFFRNQILSSFDQLNIHLTRAFFAHLYQYEENVDSILNRIDQTTLEDIHEILSKLKLTTSYIISGGDDDEDMENF